MFSTVCKFFLNQVIFSQFSSPASSIVRQAGYPLHLAKTAGTCDFVIFPALYQNGTVNGEGIARKAFNNPLSYRAFRDKRAKDASAPGRSISWPLSWG